MSRCIVDNCRNSVVIEKRQLCFKHYNRWRMYRDTSVCHRPWELVPNRKERYKRISPEEWDRRKLASRARKKIGKKARKNERRAAEKAGRSTLSFLHRKEMRRIYRETPNDHDVDHIIPLKHPDVCGLHVPWNLEIIPREANQRKGNKIFLDRLEPWFTGCVENIVPFVTEFPSDIIKKDA